MWKAVVLVVCLLVAGIHGMEGPSYGVKLCGREFIRAVIFTCGGSRWKRSLGSKEVDAWGSQDEPISDQPSGVDSSLQLEEIGESGFKRTVRSVISEEILQALRRDDRKGRGVVVGLSNACCKWGCSKSEISSLC
ncbi:relaxin-3a isoform X1 [Gadus morhua]|uniref:Relaxin-3 n=1 Tax=Gadus morhua TaxID=8049 RepID=A0A8C4ZCW0_GADMO|nr:relaxin-3-like isoform X1 [Gadus morhua]XP_056434628.1 relaxin-3a [Gadus chalcogrammus]